MKIRSTMITMTAVLAIGTVIAPLAEGQTGFSWRWKDSSTGGDWADGNNWEYSTIATPRTWSSDLGFYPGQLAADTVMWFERPRLSTPSDTVIISTVIPFNAGSWVHFGPDSPAGGAGLKVVDGGEIIIGGGANPVWFGRNSGNTGSLIMEGGMFIRAGTGELGIGITGGTGRILMTGGEIQTNLLNFGTGASDGLINLHGGVIRATGLAYGGASGQSVIDIQNDGLLILTGNHTGTINTLANGTTLAGLIRGSNGVVPATLLPGGLTPTTYNGVNWAYDGGTNSTYVYAIPEPGTIALLGLAGLAMLIRRRFVK